MSSIEITFENPLYLLLIIPVFAVILLPFLLLPKNRKRSFKKIAPVVLHLVISLILIFIVAGFSFVKKTDEQAVIVLADLSYSTQSVQESIVERTNDLLAAIDRDVPVGVIAFSGEQIYSLALEDDRRSFKIDTISDRATNLSAALEYAVSVAPADKTLRIVVMSDGKENDGNVDAMAYYLAQLGIRIDAMYFDTTLTTDPEVQITGINGKNSAYVNNTVDYTVDIKSNVNTEIILDFYDSEGKGQSIKTSVEEGNNVINVSVVPENSGINLYCAEIKTQSDTRANNNKAYTCLDVVSSPRVLIVADDTGYAQKLKNVLSKSNEVSVVNSYNAPSTISKMCKYDEIILSNVDFYSLPRGFDQLLDIYVSEYGRSVLAAGGRNTFMYGNMVGSTIENMLPVNLSLSESTESKSVALVLVLDLSSSMSGERITVAKQGAINCLEAMTDNDYVGIVSFSKDAKVDSPLISSDAENKESLKRIISSLELGRGTYYKEALKLAKGELEKSDADVKHIIFLSDGQPSDNGYDNVVKDAADIGITVSTIGLSFSSNVLDYLASVGKGRYYYVSGADDLPDIMLSETEMAKVNSYIVRDFVPKIKEASDLTEGVESELPMLNGYLGTTLKDKATVYITSDKGHPIYSSWSYGLGTVSCFTSDLSGNWTGNWYGSDIGQQLISRMVSTSLGRVPDISAMQIATKVNGSTVDIIVTTRENTEDKTMTVRAINGQTDEAYEMIKLYEGAFKCSLPINNEGEYSLQIILKDKNGGTVDELNTSIGISYPIEYDAFAPGGEALLSNMCSYSGGEIHDDVLSLADVKFSPIRITYDPVVPFSIIALLFFIADIAIRKLRWKDIQKYFIKK